MIATKALVGSAFSLCSFLIAASSTSVAGEKVTREVVSISTVSGRTGQLELAGKSMLVMTGATTGQVVGLDLVVTENRCRVREGVGDKTRERELTLWCYELRAKDEAVAYSRAVWVSRPVIGLGLFPDVHGKSYLAWVDGSSVGIEDVTQTKEMREALVSYLSRPDRYTVPVADLVGRKPFEGVNAIHSDIKIVSVGEDKTGRLQLVIEAPKTGERFELVFDGNHWTRGAE